MAVTIFTSGSTGATNHNNGRHLDRTVAVDVLWAVGYDNTSSDRLRFWYSSDDGATWTEDTGGTIATETSANAGHGFFIDADDYAHAVYENASGNLSYRRGTPNAGRTAWTWSSETAVAAAGNHYSDVVAHRQATGWKVHVVSMGTGAVHQVDYQRFNVTSGGTITSDVSEAVYATGGVGNEESRPSVDFNHTGDGKTVSGAMPHVYIGFQAGFTNKESFVKYTFSAGPTWTKGTRRELGTGREVRCSTFDGTRHVAVCTNGTTTPFCYERDAGDTSTTDRSIPALSDGNIEALSVAYDAAKNIYVFAHGATSNDPKYIKYDRAGASWGSWTQIEAATAQNETLSAKRGYSSNAVEALWTTTGAAVDYELVVALNTAPTASTWVTVPGVKDRDETLTLDWDFQDPDVAVGDTQSAYAMSRVVNGGSVEYLTAAGETWGGVEVKNVTSTTQVTLAAGWAADGDVVDYKVKTWDGDDEEGVYSAALNVTGSVQVNPVLVTPADAGTVTANTVTMTWTAAEQTQYRARLYNSGRTVTHEDSGWKTSATLTYNFGYIVTDGVTYEVGIQTRNAEGLASDEDTHTFDVDFTEPATPTLVVAADGDHIDVTITNPTATPPEPDVTGNDLYVRVAAGGITDGYRPVAGDGIRVAVDVAENGSFVDWAVGDGYAYEYLVRAFGDNSTSTDSAWTS